MTCTYCTVLITGPSPKSIGEATALAVARAGPTLLILASRSQTKLDAVAESCREVVAGGAGGVRKHSLPAAKLPEMLPEACVLF